MKDQVVMSKWNAQLAIAIPLYRWHSECETTEFTGYTVSFTNGRPIAYAIDIGKENVWISNAEFIEKNMEFLGDL